MDFKIQTTKSLVFQVSIGVLTKFSSFILSYFILNNNDNSHYYCYYYLFTFFSFLFLLIPLLLDNWWISPKLSLVLRCGTIRKNENRQATKAQAKNESAFTTTYVYQREFSTLLHSSVCPEKSWNSRHRPGMLGQSKLSL